MPNMTPNSLQDSNTFLNSLCHFENPKQSERPQAGQPERPGPRPDVHPEDLEQRSGDDGAVEPVERRLEVDPGGERVQTDQHLAHERPQEDELRVNWKRNQMYSL